MVVGVTSAVVFSRSGFIFEVFALTFNEYSLISLLILTKRNVFFYNSIFVNPCRSFLCAIWFVFNGLTVPFKLYLY